MPKRRLTPVRARGFKNIDDDASLRSRARHLGRAAAPAHDVAPLRRSRLADALVGALLALPGVSAQAAICAWPVTQYSGTSNGSLAYAIQTDCVQLTTSTPLVQLSNTAQWTSGLQFQVAGSAAPYTLSMIAPGMLLQSGLTVAYVLQGTTPAWVNLDPSWQPASTGSGQTVIGSGMTLALSSNLNLGASSGGVVLDSSGGNGTPTLAFQAPVTLSAPVTLQSTAGAINSNGNQVVLSTIGQSSASGAANLSITGGGAVSVNNGITTTGTVSIAAGASLAPLNGSYSSPQAFNVAGTLDLSRYAGATPMSVQALSGGGGVVLGSNSLIVTSGAGAAAPWSGNVSGNGKLIVQGGSEVLTAANSLFGGTFISSGAGLILSGSGSLASPVQDAGTLTLIDDSVPVSVSIAGSGTVQVASGVAYLSGKNTNTGTVQISNGATLNLLSGGTLASAAEVDSGTLGFTNNTGTIAGTIQGSGGLNLSTSHVQLSAKDTYSGGTNIGSSSSLSLAGSGSIADSGVTDNGLLDISQSSAGTAVRSLNGNGQVQLGSSALTIASGAGTFGGVIAGSGSVNVAAGSEVFSGSNSYSGQTIVASNAQLALSGTGTLGSAAETIQGVLDISGATAPTSLGGLSGAGTLRLGSNSVTLRGNGNFSGVISGSGGVVVNAAQATFSGADTYSGSTTIGYQDALALAGAGSITNSTVTNAGSFDISGAQAAESITSIAGQGNINLGANTLSLRNASGTVSGVIAGSGNLSLLGGTEVLAGVNSYSGQTSIASGATLAVSGVGTLGASTVLDNGALDASASSAPLALHDLGGQGSVLLGAGGLILTQAAGTFSGVISGSGAVSVSGGIETLGGNNAYTGSTSIGSAATLALSGTGSVAASSQLQDNGMLDVSGTTAGSSVRAIAGSGGVALGASTLRVSAASGTLSGLVTGSGGLQIDAGSQGLGAAESYTGATTISSGATLDLVGGGSVASSAVSDNGVLDISATTSGAAVGSLQGSGNVALGARTLTLEQASGTLHGNIAGSGGLTVAAGSQTLAGSDTYTGPTTIASGASLILSGSAAAAPTQVLADGRLDVSGAGSAGTVALAGLSGSGQVALGSNDLVLTQGAGDFSGQIGGTGGLTLEGGQQELSGVQTYTGATTVQAGALTLGPGSRLASGLVVRPGGVLLSQGAAAVAGGLDNSGELQLGSPQAMGTLQVGGSFSQGASGTTTAWVAPGANSTLYVAGPQLKLGGKLVIDLLPGHYLRRTYVLMQAPAGSTLVGGFSSLQVVSPQALQAYALQYVLDPQVLFTVAAAHPFSSLALTPNQLQVAHVLDSVVLTASGALYTRMNALIGQGSVSSGLQALDGELYSDTPEWLLQGTRQEWGQLFDRIGLGDLSHAAPRDRAFGFIDGSRGRLLGDANANGVQDSTTAITLGRALQRGAWNFGAAVGTLSMGATRQQVGDGMTGSLYRVGVFGGRRVHGLRLGGVLGYTQGEVDYASARRDVRIWSLESRVADDVQLRAGNLLTPLLSMDVQYLSLGSATESDPVLGLHVAAQSMTDASSLAALRAVHPWGWRRMTGDLSASLGMRHWWERPETISSLHFNAIPSLGFTNWGVVPPRNALEAALGLHAQLRRNLNVQVAYQGDLGRKLRSNQLEVHLMWNF